MKYIKFYEKWIDGSSENLLLKVRAFFKSRKKDKKVEYWLLEVNKDGSINREIGVNDKGKIVSIAPYHANRGQWVDSKVSLNPDEYKSITEEEFIEKWKFAKKE